MADGPIPGAWPKWGIGRPWMTGPPPRKGQFQRFPGRFFNEAAKDHPECFRGWEFVDRTANLLRPDAGVPDTERTRVLHMFAGSMDWGDTTDFRPESGAKFVAPYDALPPELWGKYDVCFADPPYNSGFSNEWTVHRAELPRPKRILREALKVLRPGGKLFLLHVIMVPAYKEFGLTERNRLVHFVPAGPLNAFRGVNVFTAPE